MTAVATRLLGALTGLGLVLGASAAPRAADRPLHLVLTPSQTPGAGGIGFYLQTYLRMIDYPAASTVLLVTVAMVTIVDAVASRLRDRLV